MKKYKDQDYYLDIMLALLDDEIIEEEKEEEQLEFDNFDINLIKILSESFDYKK